LSSRMVLWLRAAIAVLVVAGATVFATRPASGSGNVWMVLGILVLLLIVLWRELRQAEDERSMGIKYRAGYYAYLISLYIWLALRYLEDRFNASETFVLGMVGMTLAFVLSWAFLALRERSRIED